MQHLCSFPCAESLEGADARESMRRSSSDGHLPAARVARQSDAGAAGRMLETFARRERERRASFSEIQSWEGLQARPPTELCESYGEAAAQSLVRS